MSNNDFRNGADAARNGQNMPDTSRMSSTQRESTAAGWSWARQQQTQQNGSGGTNR